MCFEIIMELVKAFAHWWPCACLKCVSGPRSPEKSLKFSKYILVFDLVLQFCSDIIYWNWMQLSFHFFVFIDIVASVVGTIFSRLCFTFWIEIFFCCFCGNFCNWFANLLWLQMDWVWGSFLDFWLYSLTLDLNRRKSSKMLKPMSHLTT